MSRTDLDCRGLPCPRPVIELARAVAQAQPGDLIAVASDDPAAGPDIAAFCRMRGHSYAGQEQAPDDVPVFLVECLLAGGER